MLYGVPLFPFYGAVGGRCRLAQAMVKIPFASLGGELFTPCQTAAVPEDTVPLLTLRVRGSRVVSLTWMAYQICLGVHDDLALRRNPGNKIRRAAFV